MHIAIAGIGSENMVNVPVDIHARMNMVLLKKELDARFQRKQAVYAVVAVLGTTEEGAVDPLEEIINIRKDYQDKGMSFIVHVDAAWGGVR
jgi:glutamate/tyrosine decarboxylase-like PLP-dependent enzyme